MEFVDKVKQFAARIETLQNNIATEEATKTSIIMPFFQLLGYDVFNPAEFVPEFTADVGIKKGEKVDYAIVINDIPSILIEAKCITQKLDKHDSQLFRYFSTTKAKFAILTNGIVYRFYTDLEQSNIMDSEPFWECNLLDLKDADFNELRKFHKNDFDIQNVLNAASDLKYSNTIYQFMQEQLTMPSDDFVKYLLSHIYTGVETQSVIEKFKPVVKKSLNQFITNMLNDRLKSAIQLNNDPPAPEVTDETEDPVTSAIEPQIVTTALELEAFGIIKSMLRGKIDLDKIAYKDTLSYFGILIDNNTRKWLCRLYIKDNVCYIIIPNTEQEPIRYDFKKSDELFELEELLFDRLNYFIQPSKTAEPTV